MIATGMSVVTFSIVCRAWSVGRGPTWLIALSSAMQGVGFGMAWTFILRRATSLASPGETERVTAAIPTIQRLGYALGAAYIGIIANASGIDRAPGDAELVSIATTIFLGCLPLAMMGLIATGCFVRSSAE